MDGYVIGYPCGIKSVLYLLYKEGQAGGAGSGSAPLFLYPNILFNDALDCISDFFNLYYISHIKKKRLKKYRYYICLLLLVHNGVQPRFAGVVLHSLTFALQSWVNTNRPKSDSQFMVNIAPGLRSNVSSSVRKAHTTPNPLLLFAPFFFDVRYGMSEIPCIQGGPEFHLARFEPEPDQGNSIQDVYCTSHGDIQDSSGRLGSNRC